MRTQKDVEAGRRKGAESSPLAPWALAWLAVVFWAVAATGIGLAGVGVIAMPRDGEQLWPGLVSGLAPAISKLESASEQVVGWLAPVFPAVLVAILVWLAIPQRQPVIIGWDDDGVPEFDDADRVVELNQTRSSLSLASMLIAGTYLAWSLLTIIAIAHPEVQVSLTMLAQFVLLPIVLLLGAACGRFAPSSPEVSYIVAARGAEVYGRWFATVDGWTPRRMKRAFWVAVAVCFTLVVLPPIVVSFAVAGESPWSTWAFLATFVMIALPLSLIAVRNVAVPGTLTERVVYGGGSLAIWVGVMVLAVSWMAVSLIPVGLLLLFALTIAAPSLVWLLPWWGGTFPAAGPLFVVVSAELTRKLARAHDLQAELRSLYPPEVIPLTWRAKLASWLAGSRAS